MTVQSCGSESLHSRFRSVDLSTHASTYWIRQTGISWVLIGGSVVGTDEENTVLQNVYRLITVRVP